MHATYLLQALSLARRRRGFCAPNPAVGALIVKQGAVIATGHHTAAGEAHAEVVALQQAGEAARGATLYVTLEPCCTWGRTPPCTQQIIEAGVSQVVYGAIDPNTRVSGQGVTQLQAAGVHCEHLLLDEITFFYRSYQYWLQHQRPWVTAKIALSLDGKIAAESGAPVAITGAELKAYTHQKRESSDVVLTTAHTIAADNPQLNVRLAGAVIAKPVLILDSKLCTDPQARIFNTAAAVTLFHKADVDRSRIDAFEQRGVQCIVVAEQKDGLSLPEVLRHLGKFGHHDVWVEAGGVLFSQLYQQDLVNTALIYLSPHTLGRNATAAFTEKLDFQATDKTLTWEQFGQDMLLRIDS